MLSLSGKDSKANNEKLLFAFMLGLLIFTLVLHYSCLLEEPDLWFHMAYGKYFLAHHTLIPDHSIFNWSPADNSQIYCAWISQIILFLLYDFGGIEALFALRYICLLIFFLFIWNHIKKTDVWKHPLAWIICIIGGWTVHMGIQIRSEIFSFVLMTCCVWTWWKIKRSGDQAWQYCYLFPVLFVIWMNSHGGVIFGIIFLASILFGELLNGFVSHEEMLSARTRKHFFFSAMLCSIALCLTPYGIRYPQALISELLFQYSSSVDLLKAFVAYKNIFYPVFKVHHFFIILLISLSIFFVLLYPRVRERKIDWALVVSTGCFCFLYVKFARTTFYFTIINTFSTLYLLSVYKPQVIIAPLYKSLIKRSQVAIFVLIALYFIYRSLSSPTFGFGIDCKSPVKEVDLCLKHLALDKVGSDYITGSYLLWALAPNTKVFIDARFFPFKAWIDEFIKLDNSDKKYKDWFFQKYASDVWCISYDNPELYGYFLESPDWKLIFYGSTACVFARKQSAYTFDSNSSGRALDDVDIVQAIPLTGFLIQINDFGTAAMIAEKIISDPKVFFHKKSLQAFYRDLGGIFMEKKRYDEAIKTYSLYLRLRDDDPETYFFLGNAFYLSTRINGAIACYEKALSLKPDHFGVRHNLGNALLLVNDVERSIYQYDEALRLCPSNASVLRARSIAVNRRESIIADIARILRASNPNSPDVKSMKKLSALYSYVGQYDESLKYLNKLAGIDPGNPGIYFDIARIYGKKSDAGNALNYLKMSISKGFNNWQVLLYCNELELIRDTEYYKETVLSRSGNSG